VNPAEAAEDEHVELATVRPKRRQSDAPHHVDRLYLPGAVADELAGFAADTLRQCLAQRRLWTSVGACVRMRTSGNPCQQVHISILNLWYLSCSRGTCVRHSANLAMSADKWYERAIQWVTDHVGWLVDGGQS